MPKKVVVSVTNDLSFDQRVNKMCTTLSQMGFEVELIGRLLPDSQPLKRDYKTKRMRLFFKKGALFYAFFNLRLFIVLLFKKVDIYHANDLDTLLANYLAAKIRGKKLVYDSHEYFLGVPEIQGRAAKKVWAAIERFIFPKLEIIFTVNQSIADLYEKDYGKKLKIVRNLPLQQTIEKVKTRLDLKMPNDKRIIILQGAGINVDRGAEELLEAVALSDDYVLYIVGTGDVIEDLKRRARQADLQNKVVFVGRVPYPEMMQYTLNADVGVTLDKDTNINYRFSLPNKIFDYMKAGIPIVASNLKEVANIIHTYNVGVVIKDHTPHTILEGLNAALQDQEQVKVFARNGLKGVEELNWENEVQPVKEIYTTFID
ncbi:MAG: glycosyltransferase [Flavobacteriales bacterium]|jgi:glycosyltransferase involved in cell wall biosynthesis|nr:glycosyltransferase [Flavobacteriales bacterium]